MNITVTSGSPTTYSPKNASSEGPSSSQNSSVVVPSISTGPKNQPVLELKPAQDSKGNESSGEIYHATGTERYSHIHLPTGNESSERPSDSETRGPTPTRGISERPRELTNKPATLAGSRVSNDVTRVVPVTSNGSTSWRSTGSLTTHAVTLKPTRNSNTRHKDHHTRDSKGHTCPTSPPQKDTLVGRCLVAIAVLTALATTFLISTIILAVKQSGNQFRYKSDLLVGTEMVSISTLINDNEHPSAERHKHPKSNGTLISSREDSDGDDLTLNSYLPDADCAS
ncbi:P-selectin glycoprotein ligand 1 [Chanos chanos]|uniref:P-selectin glycoprotein ligand 1 n=1 Tax=Chanos chanos TaxID=29144 RepID=A0A6J2WTN1_CHACN|nr:P-selectin glycoprotein ligand 1 [Chanos chanos]